MRHIPLRVSPRSPASLHHSVDRKLTHAHPQIFTFFSNAGLLEIRMPETTPIPSEHGKRLESNPFYPLHQFFHYCKFANGVYRQAVPFSSAWILTSLSPSNFRLIGLVPRGAGGSYWLNGVVLLWCGRSSRG